MTFLRPLESKSNFPQIYYYFQCITEDAGFQPRDAFETAKFALNTHFTRAHGSPYHLIERSLSHGIFMRENILIIGDEVSAKISLGWL